MPTAQELLEQSRKELEEQNRAALERTENVQPTPTQAEVDMAKLATPTLETLDGKDDHGAPDEKSVEASGSAAYKTRASRARKSAQQDGAE